MTVDTVCAMYSATKAIAGTACLQLVEDGALDLDAPAARYVPELGELEVLEGFDDHGIPRTRPPKRAITTRMLLLHTAGFGYDFCDETTARMIKALGRPRVGSGAKASLQTPLLFDPGERWSYGVSLDWAGQVVERITGQRLGTFLNVRLFEPLGMSSTAFALSADMRARLARLHARQADGGLAAMDTFELPQAPEIQMAGHGLYSTPEDYAKFIRLWLNDGRGPDGTPVLKPETIAMAAEDGLPRGMRITPLPAVNPKLTNPAEFFAGLPKGWALTFMVNNEVAPTGRSAGSLAWAGLPNVYFWIDRARGVGGIWAAQVFPFMDHACIDAYYAFETAVYAAKATA